MDHKDAFDVWWEWEEKPLDSSLRISADEAVTALPPAERPDRARVNDAVREGVALGPLRPAGTADEYNVPRATE